MQDEDTPITAPARLSSPFHSLFDIMSTLELDDRGLLLACPQCGQRNRLIYQRLGQTFRCRTVLKSALTHFWCSIMDRECWLG